MDGLRDGISDTIRKQLLARRQRLDGVLNLGPEPGLLALLREVDAALERLDDSQFGLCDVCHEPVETERLLANPLVRTCLDHLSESEQAALERDLLLAAEVQRKLLPPHFLQVNGWELSYHYQPFRVASGDYCDVVSPGRDLYILLGDVSGKGVAASMLVANLHGLFRTLLAEGCNLSLAFQRANRIFCESTMTSHYATLICLKAHDSGLVSVANAGHCAPVLLTKDKVVSLESTGLPLGVFCDASYETATVELGPNDAVFAYTDGFSEAQNAQGIEYGSSLMPEWLRSNRHRPSRELISGSLADMERFRSGAPLTDDLTLLCLKRVGGAPAG